MFNRKGLAVRDDNRQDNRRVTLTLDDELVRKAQELVGARSTGELIRQGLAALIERGSSKRIALLTQEHQGIRDECTESGTFLSVNRRSVESRPADPFGGTEREVDEAALSLMVAEVKRALIEARSELREGLSEMRATLNELRASRRR